MLAPLNESVLPHGIRSRLVAGINGLTVHVLEAGFEMASASPAAGQEFRRAREAVLTRATYFAELCVSPRRVRVREQGTRGSQAVGRCLPRSDGSHRLSRCSIVHAARR